MKAMLKVYCEGCAKHLGPVSCDTADMPNDLQRKINKVILDHRLSCPYYGQPVQSARHRQG